MPMPPKLILTPDQKRLRVIILSFPVAVATSWVLYKRLYLGEEQRKMQPGDTLFTPVEGRANKNL